MAFLNNYNKNQLIFGTIILFVLSILFLILSLLWGFKASYSTGPNFALDMSALDFMVFIILLVFFLVSVLFFCFFISKILRVNLFVAVISFPIFCIVVYLLIYLLLYFIGILG